MKKLISLIVLCVFLTNANAQLSGLITAAKNYNDSNIVTNATRQITAVKINTAFGRVITALKYADSLGVGDSIRMNGDTLQLRKGRAGIFKNQVRIVATDTQYLRRDINLNATNVATNTSNIALKANIASPTFTGTPTAPSLRITGTGGTGYLELANQSAAPSTPTSASRLYFDNSNRLSWKGTNGFVRTFDGTANTADRIYTLPNTSGTIILDADTIPLLRKTSNALLTLLAPNLAATQDYTKGILVANPTPSTVGVPEQISPAFMWQSQARNTGAAGSGVAGGDNTFFWKVEARAISGAEASGMTNSLVFAQKFGTNNYADVVTFTEDGIVGNIVQNILTLGGNSGVNGQLILKRENGLTVGAITAATNGDVNHTTIGDRFTFGTSSTDGTVIFPYYGLWVGLQGVNSQFPLSRVTVAGGSNANVSIGSNIAAPTNGLAVVGQTLIGASTIDASAKLQVDATTQGFLPPRMTAAQASAIASPAEGLMVYVTNTSATFLTKGWWGWNGAAWEKLNN